MQQAIQILDEMIKESYDRTDWNMTSHSIERNILEKAKFRIQPLNDWWIPFETPPEKEWIYLTYWDDLNNNVWPRVMNYVNWSFECWDWAEFPTHWKHIWPIPLSTKRLPIWLNIKYYNHLQDINH